MKRYFNFDLYNSTRTPVDCSTVIETNEPFIRSSKSYELSVIRAQIPLSRVPVCTPGYLKGCAVGIMDPTIGKPSLLELESNSNLTIADFEAAINRKFTEIYEEIIDKLEDQVNGTFHVKCKINNEGALSFTAVEAYFVEPDEIRERPVDSFEFYISEALFPLFGTIPHSKQGDIYNIEVTAGKIYPASLTNFMEFDRLSVISDLPVVPEICVSTGSTYGQKILTDYSLLQVSDFSSYAIILPQVERWISMLNSTDLNRTNLRIHLRSKTGNDVVLTIAPKFNLAVKICIKEI